MKYGFTKWVNQKQEFLAITELRLRLIVLTGVDRVREMRTQRGSVASMLPNV